LCRWVLLKKTWGPRLTPRGLRPQHPQRGGTGGATASNTRLRRQRKRTQRALHQPRSEQTHTRRHPRHPRQTPQPTHHKQQERNTQKLCNCRENAEHSAKESRAACTPQLCQAAVTLTKVHGEKHCRLVFKRSINMAGVQPSGEHHENLCN
jgi:hypothetical protein